MLDIWRYDEELIKTATEEEILRAVNHLKRSPWTGIGQDYSELLGGIKRNSSGDIVSAKTAIMLWRLKVPEDAEFVQSQGSGVEVDLADKTTLDWESAFIEIGLNSTSDEFEVYINGGRSFSDISAQAISSDMFLLLGGYAIMFIYTIIMLGNFNSREVRLFLTISGLVSIGMGISIAISISSLIGYPYTPMHSALPLLCLGKNLFPVIG